MAENYKKEIRCCPNHYDYKVPLIFTFAFYKKELWCPFCGYKAGLFGATRPITETPELLKRLEVYTEKSKHYLSDVRNNSWTQYIKTEDMKDE